MGPIDIDQIGHPKVGQHDMRANHENIRRLFNGTENKFGRKKAAAITAED